MTKEIITILTLSKGRMLAEAEKVFKKNKLEITRESERSLIGTIKGYQNIRVFLKSNSGFTNIDYNTIFELQPKLPGGKVRYLKNRISTARAGNVIGGGDFSSNRLIPDIVSAINNKKKLIWNVQSLLLLS